MWELSFLRDGTGAAALEGRSPTDWTTGQVPHALFFFFKIFPYGPLFKVFIEFVTTLLFLMFWF